MDYPLMMAVLENTLIFGDKDHSAYMTDNLLIEKGISQVEFDCTKMGDALLTAIVALRQCIFSQFLHLLLKSRKQGNSQKVVKQRRARTLPSILVNI